MSKNKLKKFAELESFKHVIQPTFDELDTNFYLKGKWRSDFFKNSFPITLELGCGKGEYTTELAKEFPQKNFIGIDIKGSRMWTGAKYANENNLKNVAFLRTRIDMICKCFEKNEVDEIWITFPDPQIKRKRVRKRLTHPIFLKKYSHILKPKSKIHLKTDSQFFYGFTLGVIASEGHMLDDATSDLYNSLVKREHLHIKTFYEKMFLKVGKPITYLCFRLNYKD